MGATKLIPPNVTMWFSQVSLIVVYFFRFWILGSDIPDSWLPDRMDWAQIISLWRKSRTCIGRGKKRLNWTGCERCTQKTMFTMTGQQCSSSLFNLFERIVRVIGCFTWIDTSGHKTWPQYKQYLELGKQKPYTWIESSGLTLDGEGTWRLMIPFKYSTVFLDCINWYHGHQI